MGSCQNKGEVVIKSNYIPNKKININSNKHNNIDDQIDPKFDDKPLWPCIISIKML